MIGVAFDIGGTFTDFVLSDDRTGATHALKVPTSVHNLGEAVIEGLESCLPRPTCAGVDRRGLACPPLGVLSP